MMWYICHKNKLVKKGLENGTEIKGFNKAGNA